MRSLIRPAALAFAALALLPAVQAQDAAQQLAAKPFTRVAPFPPGGPVIRTRKIEAQ
jgi:tripartite-type tricarboxylate transporter receptor subunit TctC